MSVPYSIRLSPQALANARSGLSAPAYDRGAARVGMVHIGVGGFHRAHQAAYLDQLMAAGHALDWGICGVGLLPGDRAVADALGPQDNLYCLTVKHPDGTVSDRVIGSLLSYLYAPDAPDRVLDQLCDPAVRIVSLTITEGGYVLDPDHVDVRHDLSSPARPRTAFGFLVEALRRRRSAGIEAFTVLSCDNVLGNGDVARRAVSDFAALADPGFAAWIAQNVAFPNSMVDRITPMTTDDDRAAVRARHGVFDAWPVVCEPFRQWVIEDDFPTGRPRWELVGAQLVGDVRPYEQMKLRTLNGSHQLLAYLGDLRGHEHVHGAIADEGLAQLLSRYLAREAAPTVPPVPGVDLADYAGTLLERFGNPQISDTIARLAAYSSDRVPTFVLPVVRDNLARGADIAVAMLGIAAWAGYVRRHPDLVDNRADQLRSHACAADPDAFVSQRDLFGDLAADARFVAAYRRACAALDGWGAGAGDPLAAEGRTA